MLTFDGEGIWEPSNVSDYNFLQKWKGAAEESFEIGKESWATPEQMVRFGTVYWEKWAQEY